MLRFTIALLIGTLFFSCTQEEGLGGTSSIRGSLIEKTYNDNYSLLLSEKEAKDEDLYLLFGNETVVGDKTSTSYTGEFEFTNLWPGTYKVFYYSDDINTKDNELIEVVNEITVGNNESVDLGKLTVVDTKDFDDGTSSISGEVSLINYRNSSSWPFLIVKDTTHAQEQEVYLVYGDHKQYDQRIRTNYDGTFSFTNLIRGSYKIYLYSEDVTGGTEKIVKSYETEITSDNAEISLGEIYVEQL